MYGFLLYHSTQISVWPHPSMQALMLQKLELTASKIYHVDVHVKKLWTINSISTFSCNMQKNGHKDDRSFCALLRISCHENFDFQINHHFNLSFASIFSLFCFGHQRFLLYSELQNCWTDGLFQYKKTYFCLFTESLSVDSVISALAKILLISSSPTFIKGEFFLEINSAQKI